MPRGLVESGSRVLVDDAPLLEHEHVVGQLEAEAHVLLDHEQAGAALAHLAQGPAQLLDHLGREPGRRLVDEQQAGLGHQGAGHGEHGPLATGERPGQLPAALGQAGIDVVHALEVGLEAARVAQDGATQAQVLGHGQLGEHRLGLQHVAQAAPNPVLGVEAVEGAAVELHGAAPRRLQARDRLERDRLAGAVEAEQHGGPPGRQRQVDAVQDLVGTEAGDELADPSRGVVAHVRRSPR